MEFNLLLIFFIYIIFLKKIKFNQYFFFNFSKSFKIFHIILIIYNLNKKFNQKKIKMLK